MVPVSKKVSIDFENFKIVVVNVLKDPSYETVMKARLCLSIIGMIPQKYYEKHYISQGVPTIVQ